MPLTLMTACDEGCSAETKRCRRHALEANAANTAIERIVVLAGGGSPDLDLPKVEIVRVARRPTYAKLFDHAAASLRDRVCLLADACVRFDQSLSYFDDVDFSQTYLVTGHGRPGSGDTRPFDALAFRAPVDRFRADFVMGAAGAEERLAGEMQRADLTVRDVRSHVRAFIEPAAQGVNSSRQVAPPPVPRPPEGPKVFGIGLQRTGTSSFRRALNVLGIPTLELYGAWFLVKLRGDRLKFEPSVNHTFFQGYADSPVPMLFRELDAMFPGSRFVYFTRDPRSWLRSMGRLFAIKPYWDETPEGRVYNAFHEMTYGVADFDPDAFLAGYERHRNMVLDYFADRHDDLLVLDCGERDKWARLCPFLDRGVPEVPYPHVNRRGFRPLWKLRRMLTGRVPRPAVFRARIL